MKRLFFSILVVLLTGSRIWAQQLAFPGAEGYGAYATGGRGCQVVHVTNLNATGAGSLADAVSQSNRFVVFDVGGVIDITGTNLTIASNVTVAGQTAPGEGITIYGGRVIATNSKNVILRYLRMRGGKSVNSSKCTLTLDNCENLIMDHCSISWGPWDNVHIKDANNITWQYCINSEGIEPQRFGSITDGTRNWTISHCLWADNKSRNPKMKCYLQYYNNVVYNYGMGIIGGHSAADNYQDVMNNYFIAGPNGSAKYFDDWTSTDHLYSSGNYFDGNCDGRLNGSLITDYHSATPMSQANFKTTHPMNLETAKDAYYNIVEQVGASRVRDIHDKRIIEQLTSLGTKGAFIASEDDVQGIGSVAGGSKPTDSDNDGMPDDWEEANGLNPKRNDANGYDLGGGYTNIEHYVNSLAQKTAFLMYPLNPSATLTDETTVELTWTNEQNEEAVAIVVEQSTDNRTFTEVQRLEATATKTTITGLTPGQIYYFRLKTVGSETESAYSATVSVNDEFMRPGGGVPAGTTTFVPAEGKLYRIVNYATVPYNSSTNLNGTPKYLTFNANGTLGATEVYEWDNPALLWEITAVTGGVTLRNYATRQYIAATNSTIDSAERIGVASAPAVLTINYVGDKQPSQSGLYTPISMYRINSPSNRDQQIRARGFVDDWVWGSGTIDRADMVFTFVAVDASLVKLYLKGLQSAIEGARKLVGEAEVDVTNGYPSSALNALLEAVAAAQSFLDNMNEETTQDEVEATSASLTQAITAFQSTRINTLMGYSTEVCYNIYSYGTTSNASAANADPSIQRRYLYALKSADGQRDSLAYRIGLSDSDISAGKNDGLTTSPAALWAISDAGDGYVYVRSQKFGSYMQIERLLSAEAVAIHPTYAKEDNGKMAFYMDADETGKRLFNVGAPDANGKGGPLDFFAMHADRTRLRWVFDKTSVAVNLPTTVRSLSTTTDTVLYYSVDGRQLARRPRSGICLVKQTLPDGSVVVRKLIVTPG